MKIRKDDTVLVITGKDRGKKAKVRFAFPKDKMLIIEGVNFVKKHSKAKGAAKQAGIIDIEEPMHISKVMFYCTKCSKPARLGSKTLEDGRSVRFCRNCGEVAD
jgi:large subunit ribosomal protein L24